MIYSIIWIEHSLSNFVTNIERKVKKFFKEFYMFKNALFFSLIDSLAGYIIKEKIFFFFHKLKGIDCSVF